VKGSSEISTRSAEIAAQSSERTESISNLVDVC
jgi:hypothetical protein